MQIMNIKYNHHINTPQRHHFIPHIPKQETLFGRTGAMHRCKVKYDTKDDIAHMQYTCNVHKKKMKSSYDPCRKC